MTIERPKTESGLETSFETTRFTLCRRLTGAQVEIEKVAEAHVNVRRRSGDERRDDSR